MNTETFPTNTDDVRIPDNLQTMTTLEKRVWIMGIIFSLLVLLCTMPYFRLLVFDDSRSLAYCRLIFGIVMPLIGVIMPLSSLWARNQIKWTTTDTHIFYKATSWTVFGMAIVVCIMSISKGLFFPSESITISTNALGFGLGYIFLVFLSTQLVLWACLLRKERLTNAKSTPTPCKQGG